MKKMVFYSGVMVVLSVILLGCGESSAESQVIEAPVTDVIVWDETDAQSVRPVIPFEEFLVQSPVDIILVEVEGIYGRLQRFPLVFTEHGLIRLNTILPQVSMFYVFRP